MSRREEIDEVRTFTLPQLAELSGIDYRTLHNWQKRGMLGPSHQVATGSGTVNLFDVTDALQILILAELRRGGLEVRVLEAVAERVRQLAEQITEEELLVVSEETVSLARTAELRDKVSFERPSFVLSMGRIRATLASLAPAGSS